MRKLIVLALLVGLLAAGALSISASGASTRSVAVRDNFYSFKLVRSFDSNSPKRLSVSKGTTITWRWRGAAKHDVAWTRGPVKFRRSRLTANHSYTYSRTLNTRGTYKVVCTVHQFSDNMVMTIKVT